MPSSNIHLKVAYELNKRLNINSIDFIVGNISPDAVNLNGFAPRELRWTAHLRDKDLNIWKNNAIEFYENNKKSINNNFLLGYVTHILTDIIHDEYLYRTQIKQIITDTKCMDEEAHDLLRNDMNNYTFNEYNIVKEQLINYKNTYEIRNISKELLSNWILKVIDIYNENTTSKYQTDRDIEFLITTVENEVRKLLK